MRTRLLRPEFWSDSRMADLPYGTRLTYMGLWSLADDDGYLRWELRDIAAELYRFESPRKRETRVEQQLAELVAAGRVQVLPCGRHALIASIPKYRVKGGNQTFQHHKVHTDECSVRTSTDKSLSVSVTESGSSSVSFTGSVRAPAREKSTGSKNPSDEEFLAESRAIVANPAGHPAWLVKEAEKAVRAADEAQHPVRAN